NHRRRSCRPHRDSRRQQYFNLLHGSSYIGHPRNRLRWSAAIGTAMRLPTISFILFTVVLACNAAWAAQSGIQGPGLGYVFDSGMQTIRPVNGILGSSMFGQPLDLPFPVAAAVFSPRGDFALAVSASEGQTARVLRNLGGTNDSNSIDGAISGADGVFLNADA